MRNIYRRFGGHLGHSGHKYTLTYYIVNLNLTAPF